MKKLLLIAGIAIALYGYAQEVVKYTLDIQLKDQTTVSYEVDDIESFSFSSYTQDQNPSQGEEYLGTGKYTYTAFWNGKADGIRCTKITPTESDGIYTLKLEPWGQTDSLLITVNTNYQYSDGGYPVMVYRQPTGYVHPTYGNVYAVEYGVYCSEYYGGDPLDYAYGSEYYPEKGRLNLLMSYIAPEYNEWASFGYDFEKYVLDDFNAEVSMAVTGVTEEDGKYYIETEVSCGSFASTIAFGCAEDSKATNLTEEDFEIVQANESLTWRFPIDNLNTHTIYAESRDADGNQLESCSITLLYYVLEGYLPEGGEWESLGTGYFIDGWITPLFGYTNENGEYAGFNPNEYGYEVEIQKAVDSETKYRIVNPYSSDGGNAVVAQINEMATMRSIVFDTDNPDMVTFSPANSGFAYQENIFYICDGTWYGREMGLTDRNIMRSGMNSYYDESAAAFYVQYPMATWGNKDWMQTNSSGYQSIIYLPEGYEILKANGGVESGNNASAPNKAIMKNNGLSKAAPEKNSTSLGLPTNTTLHTQQSISGTPKAINRVK
ncbi:MAG: hypothetical protein LUD17_10805 [Bacteroidales bacterium]|nr:hypothetical protein [Bacteroidales bacterium]